MGRDREVDHQVPHHVVVAESLHGIDPGSQRVTHAARGDQHDQGRGGMAQKERKEEQDRPPHDQINRQAQRGPFAARQRLAEYAQEHRHPLQRRHQHPLPPSEHHERHGGIASGDGHVDADVVQHAEYAFVPRLRLHRMVERGGEEHQEHGNHEEAHGRRRGHAVRRRMPVGPHRGEGQRRQCGEGHDTVCHGIGALLAGGRNILFSHLHESFRAERRMSGPQTVVFPKFFVSLYSYDSKPPTPWIPHDTTPSAR